jgi:hypothetical protein
MRSSSGFGVNFSRTFCGHSTAEHGFLVRPTTDRLAFLPGNPDTDRSPTRRSAPKRDFESVRGGSTPPGATARESPAPCAGQKSVQGRRSAAARADPLPHGLAASAALSRPCLLPRPARAQTHRPVAARALLRLELSLLFRVRQVRNILGKRQSVQMAMSFSRDLLACE